MRLPLLPGAPPSTPCVKSSGAACTISALPTTSVRVSLPRVGGHPARDYAPRSTADAAPQLTPDSFKKDAVRRLMARGSKTVAELAAELGVSPSMLHRWRETFESEVSGSAPQRSQGEREEVEQLRRRLRDLEAENSLLKKAAALFAEDVK